MNSIRMVPTTVLVQLRHQTYLDVHDATGTILQFLAIWHAKWIGGFNKFNQIPRSCIHEKMGREAKIERYQIFVAGRIASHRRKRPTAACIQRDNSNRQMPPIVHSISSVVGVRLTLILPERLTCISTVQTRGSSAEMVFFFFPSRRIPH